MRRCGPNGFDAKPTVAGRVMEDGAMVVSMVVCLFVLFADPIEEAGLDWRGAVVAACDLVTGKPIEAYTYE
jgi:hypothetical protein